MEIKKEVHNFNYDFRVTWSDPIYTCHAKFIIYIFISKSYKLKDKY